MSTGFTDSIGSTEWSQTNECDIEIRIPAALPDGVRPKDLSVVIKDSCILCISAGSVPILQWRLYGPVENESVEDGVSWVVEDNKIVVDLKKKYPGADWSCLLDLPIRKDDALLLSDNQLENMMESHYPHQVARAPAQDDLDAIADECLEESEKEPEDNAPAIAICLWQERRNNRNTAKSVSEKLKDVKKQIEESGEEDPEALATVRILEKMLEINQKIISLREQPTTLENFFEVTRLGLEMALINSGSKTALEGKDEDEPFGEEEEKELSATDLLTLSLTESSLQEEARLHFLRLGAIHHKSSQCIAVLFRRYPTLPIGSYLLFKRAMDDEDPSAEANHMLGELFSTGTKYFVPILPVAVYFFQRSAKLGYVAGMLSLAQIWSRGSTETSMLSREESEALKNVSWYHGWIQKAVDRGSGAALFVQGCMYISGEGGIKPSYQKAKQLLDAAAKTSEEVSQLVHNTAPKLEALRAEESAARGSPTARNGKADTSSPVTTQPSTSEARLSALSSSTRGGSGAVVPRDGRGEGGAVERTKKGVAGAGKAAAAARRMRLWERVGRYSVVGYGLFTLAFPLRAMFLPYFYNAIAGIVQTIPWLANPEYTGSPW